MATILFDFGKGFLSEVWFLTREMAPYLLFGFLVAGILNLIISAERVARHLSKPNFGAVLKAAVFGIPLPLCSCSVIPVAAHLEKQGANRGSILSFLISTPSTGVDSIAATYALMGPLLAIMRPITALVNGLAAGILGNRFLKNPRTAPVPVQNTENLPAEAPKTASGRMAGVVRYAFVELVADIARWLVIGVIAGALISYLLPAELFSEHLANPIWSYLLMLLIGIPMYVCATGSIPIAAALMMKGMAPGAGFIFLVAGPATNTATVSFVAGKLGRRGLLIYLSTIVTCALLFGWLVDVIWQAMGADMSLVTGHMEMLPGWLENAMAFVLIGLLLYAIRPRRSEKLSPSEKSAVLSVPSMNCRGCISTIEAALREVRGLDRIHCDLSARRVEISGDVDLSELLTVIEKAGYPAEPLS